MTDSRTSQGSFGRALSFGWEAIIKPILPRAAAGAAIYLATNTPTVGDYLRYKLDFRVYLMRHPEARELRGLRAEIPIWAVLLVLVALTTVPTWVQSYFQGDAQLIVDFEGRLIVI